LAELDDNATHTFLSSVSPLRRLRAQEDKERGRPIGRYGSLQAPVVRGRYTTDPSILCHSQRALLHARPVPTVGSRILAHNLRALIRPAQHWLITASLLGPRLIRSFGNRVLSLAYILQTAGLGWIILTLNSFGASLTLYELSPPLIVFGAGAGFALSPLLGVILSGVPSQEAGEASGVVSTSFQIGNTVGISLFGLLYYRFLNGQQSPTSYIDAFKTTVPFFVILSVAGFLVVFLLSQHRARQIIHRLEA